MPNYFSSTSVSLERRESDHPATAALWAVAPSAPVDRDHPVLVTPTALLVKLCVDRPLPPVAPVVPPERRYLEIGQVQVIVLGKLLWLGFDVDGADAALSGIDRLGAFIWEMGITPPVHADRLPVIIEDWRTGSDLNQSITHRTSALAPAGTIVNLDVEGERLDVSRGNPGQPNNVQ